MRGKAALSLALLMNEIFGISPNCRADERKKLPRGRIISRGECLQLFPGVNEKGLTGGMIYYDCQMHSSERLILSVARSAARAGADIANYVEVEGFLREGPRVCGITARDALTGNKLDIRARVVVNSSGPWLDQVLGFLNGNRPNRTLALSKAFNLLVSRQIVPEYAVGIYSQAPFKDRDAILSRGGRMFFIIPWRNRSLIGTAHLPYDADPDNFKVTEGEIQAFLDEVKESCPAAGLNRQDVCLAYGGLLPKVPSSNGTADAQLVKHYRIHDHQREQGVEGLVSVLGVKFTEARYVAEKAVDLVFRKLGCRPPKSLTAVTPLYGGQIEQFDDFLAQELRLRSKTLDKETLRSLIYNHGSAYSELLKYLDDEPDCGTPLSQVVKAEVLHGIREEMARKLSDVVFRRTELGMAGNLDDGSLRTCASIMSEELGWDESRKQKELEEVKAALSPQFKI